MNFNFNYLVFQYSGKYSHHNRPEPNLTTMASEIQQVKYLLYLILPV